MGFLHMYPLDIGHGVKPFRGQTERIFLCLCYMVLLSAGGVCLEEWDFWEHLSRDYQPHPSGLLSGGSLSLELDNLDAPNAPVLSG